MSEIDAHSLAFKLAGYTRCFYDVMSLIDKAIQHGQKQDQPFSIKVCCHNSVIQEKSEDLQIDDPVSVSWKKHNKTGDEYLFVRNKKQVDTLIVQLRAIRIANGTNVSPSNTMRMRFNGSAIQRVYDEQHTRSFIHPIAVFSTALKEDRPIRPPIIAETDVRYAAPPPIPALFDTVAKEVASRGDIRTNMPAERLLQLVLLEAAPALLRRTVQAPSLYDCSSTTRVVFSMFTSRSIAPATYFSGPGFFGVTLARADVSCCVPCLIFRPDKKKDKDAHKRWGPTCDIFMGFICATQGAANVIEVYEDDGEAVRLLYQSVQQTTSTGHSMHPDSLCLVDMNKE